jgi:hypothetical protein
VVLPVMSQYDLTIESPKMVALCNDVIWILSIITQVWFPMKRHNLSVPLISTTYLSFIIIQYVFPSNNQMWLFCKIPIV